MSDDDKPTRGPEDIRRDIERTRGDMGETVEALAEKTDVKAQAKTKVEDTKATVKAKVAGVKETAQEKVSSAKESVSSSSGDDAGGGSGGPAAAAQQAAAQYGQQAATVAKANPIPTAAIGAFVGGILFGRITKRR